jgi:hypothetical protein
MSIKRRIRNFFRVFSFFFVFSITLSLVAYILRIAFEVNSSPSLLDISYLELSAFTAGMVTGTIIGIFAALDSRKR